MIKNLIRKRESGFTIIEVLIVLAIAGLILVVVLIAIPQLQRNQRNEQRRSVASRIVAEINNFAGNNNGNNPFPSNAAGSTFGLTHFGRANNAAGSDSYMVRYLGCSGGPLGATCTVNINDPRTGGPVGVGNINSQALETRIGANHTTDLIQTNDAPGTIGYHINSLCQGENITNAGASGRNFAFQIKLEGGAIYCLDNR